MDVVADACFVVHARPLAVGTEPLLTVLDRLARTPTYHITNHVRSEVIKHGAADWYNDLHQAGRIAPTANDHKQARLRREELRKRYGSGRLPGNDDVGLMRLAEARHAVLFTDDHGFYRVAREENVVVLDILDVLIAACGDSAPGLTEIDRTLNFLTNRSPHFMPDGWKRLLDAGHTWPDGRPMLLQQRRASVTLRDIFDEAS